MQVITTRHLMMLRESSCRLMWGGKIVLAQINCRNVKERKHLVDFKLSNHPLLCCLRCALTWFSDYAWNKDIQDIMNSYCRLNRDDVERCGFSPPWGISHNMVSLCGDRINSKSKEDPHFFFTTHASLSWCKANEMTGKPTGIHQKISSSYGSKWCHSGL